MHTFVLSAVVSVWIFAVSSVDGALLTITYSGINKVGSTTYSLKCEIPSFNNQAVWSRGGAPMSTCFNSGCLTTSTPPYTFRHDSTAIYVDFNPLAASENGIQWTCEHVGDTSVNFNVAIDTSNSSSGNGLGEGGIAGIVVGILVLGVIVIIIIFMLRRQNKPANKEATCSLPINLLENADVDFSNVSTVKWTHKNQLIRNEDLQLISGQPSVIPCVSMEHSGKWTCMIQFNEPRQSKTINLYLSVNALSMKAASAYPVHLLEKLQSITNSDSVKWTHNGCPFVCDQVMYRNGNVNNPPLNVICVSLEDSGKWQCQMEFGGPEKTKTFEVHLQVKEKPVVATVSSKVELLPELREFHDIEKVEWQRNKVGVGKQLPPYIIESVSHNDYGNWLATLHLENENKTVKKFSVELKAK